MYGLIHWPTLEEPMARNERTSREVATIAGKVLAAGKATPKQAKTLAASALTQAPNKPRGKRGRGK